MGEIFYIQALLLVFPACSFQLLRTIEGVLYPSFQHAAEAAGLFANDSEGLIAMEDAVISYKSPSQLHFLFVMLILEGSPAIPIWEKFCNDMACDHGGNINGPINDFAKKMSSSGH